MPHTPWTVKRVCDVFVEAYRAQPHLNVHGRFTVVGAGAEAATINNWQIRFLSADPEGWKYLCKWAQCKATGRSVDEVSRGLGYSVSAFQRGWRRAAERVAVGLETERVNTAALLAGEAAESRMEAAGRIVPPDVKKHHIMA